jgi:DNA polymerase-3 subunit beta
MLKINRKSFIDALSVTNRAVSNKGTGSMPVLQHIRLQMDKNKGTLIGTDLESAIVYPFEGNCAKQVDILLPAKKLLDVLKNVQSNEETVNIEIKKENVASINHAEMNTLSANEFPVLPEVKESLKLTLQGFESALKRVMVAAGESDTRYVLNTVLLDFRNNVLVATDGHRLHKVNYKFGIDHEQVLLPIATAKLIKGDYIKAMITPNTGIFDNGQYTVYCRFIEGTYPKWQNVIPEKSTVKITANRMEIIELANESIPMTRERGNAGRIEVAKGRLSIEAMNPELGFNKATINAESTASGNFVFGINLIYLLETLEQLKEKKVTLQMTDPIAPIKVVEKDFLALVMPMRI